MSLKGMITADALLGMAIIMVAGLYVNALFGAYAREENKEIELRDYEQEELPCEIWCREAGLYDH